MSLKVLVRCLLFQICKGANNLNSRIYFPLQGCGEPILLAGAVVFLAIKDAISSARKDVGLTGPFRLDSPATNERVRLACNDVIAQQTAVQPGGKQGETPWSILV